MPEALQARRAAGGLLVNVPKGAGRLALDNLAVLQTGRSTIGMMQRGAVESRPAAPSPRSSFAAASARASSIGSLGALLEESSSS